MPRIDIQKICKASTQKTIKHYREKFKKIKERIHMDWRTQYCKDVNYPQPDVQNQCNLNQNDSKDFFRTLMG